MQAIWKGTISFGLVTIPIRVYSATEERNVSFRQVHEADGGRIRYKRVCEVDGNEVPYSDIGKAYELPDGRLVVLTDEDFSDLPLPTAKSIEVLEFVPAEQVDPLYFSKAYYLAADGVGVKPYVLLRDALTNSGQCALVKVAIRTRETLALLREKDGALVLQTMLWPDEVRSSEFAVPDDSVSIRSQEVGMAEAYISTLSGDFDPARYSSDYRQALEQLVQAKAAGLPMPETSTDDGQTAAVVDLVAALRASVDAAKRRREAAAADVEEAATGTDGAPVSAPLKPAKPSSAARKSTPAKSAAKPTSSKPTKAAKPASKSTAKSSIGTPKAAPKKATSKTATSKTATSKTATSKPAAKKSA